MMMPLNNGSGYSDAEAVIHQGRGYTYQDLEREVLQAADWMRSACMPAGSVVLLQSDFSLHAIAALFALVRLDCIVVPFTSQEPRLREQAVRIAQCEYVLNLQSREFDLTATGVRADHCLYQQLRREQAPGLVLFSSGTAGVPKAVVHDFRRFLGRFQNRRMPTRAIAFLLFDHIGGINTMFHVLFNGGCLIIPPQRTPDAVFSCIERYSAELLPTTPSFMSLILMSEVYKRHNVASLRLLSYGTEPITPVTLQRIREVLPGVALLQTYGLSEVGILSSRSKADNSTWVRVGGACFETRVVDGLLQIKSDLAMLGYLNAPSPFTPDGWMTTNDCVEVDGEFIHIKGRINDLINVAGQKVFPAEIENVISEMENVADVVVYSEPNLILGNLVCANVHLIREENPGSFMHRLHSYCRERLAPFKIPMKVHTSSASLCGERFKKLRSSIRCSSTETQ